jgi:hypothetical protein
LTTEFTTNAIVLAALKGFGTGLTTTEIDAIINMCEGHLKARLRIPSTFTFSASNIAHLALRDACTAMTCLRVLAATPQSCNTLDEVVIAAEINTYIYEEAMKILDTQNSEAAIDFVTE